MRRSRPGVSAGGGLAGLLTAARRCHFDGHRDYCQGAATTQRGSVPLCGECERRSSSLTRLPREPVGRAAAPVPGAPTPAPVAATDDDHNARARAQAAAYVAAHPPGRIRSPESELGLIARQRARLAQREVTAVKVARAEGLSWPEIARALDLPLTTVHRHYRR